MKFIILYLDWNNLFTCGMKIPYFVYWIYMLSCTSLRFDVCSFNGSISMLFYIKNDFFHTKTLAGQFTLIN